jgi:hypothetical protein
MTQSILQRSAWLAWALLILSALGAATLVLDDQPPFKMIAYTTQPVKPGGVLRVEALVKRDMTRPCSVVFSRHIFDSVGTRHDISAATPMTVVALQGLEKATPGRLVLAVKLPDHIALGKAQLVTPLVYQCNAWHSLKPIEETMTMTFEVTP